MQILRAQSAGFCLGVSLALKRLDRELAIFADNAAKKLPRGRLLTLGPIIHNPLVMRRYAEQGVLLTDDPAHVQSGDRVVLRAHGIPKEVEKLLQEAGAHLVDATCPKVKKAQTAIGKTAAKGGILLLFGEKEHPEVRGLLSYAGPGSLVFGSLAELEKLDIDPAKPYFLAAQTTQERSAFRQAKECLEQRFGRPLRTLDTICDATRSRQQEVIDLCGSVRAMVVVGGFNSGNTRRLAEVALAAGIAALHIEQPSDLSEADLTVLRNCGGPVGLTAGASTPQEHIDAVQCFLEAKLP